MSKHVLNTRLSARILEEHRRVAGSFAHACCRTVTPGRRPLAPMSIDNCAPRRDLLSEHDALPPDDRSSEGEWRADVEALYRERADHLIGHFASASADRDAARDIVHEAFAKFAALSFARRLMIARPDAYLYRICLNLLRDRTRAQQTHHSHRQQQPEAVHCHNPFVELEHRDTLRRLEAAMLRLKPKTREIFLAKRLDGMTYAEIAERTGLSVRSVEQHMRKAIAAVRRSMERERR